MLLLKAARSLTSSDHRCQVSGALIVQNGAWSNGYCPESTAPSAQLHAESLLRYVDQHRNGGIAKKDTI